MREVIAMRILPEDFETFRKLMPNDPTLGDYYGEWLQRRHADDLTQGEGVKRVVVRPEEFGLYCAHIGQRPSYFMLEAFAAKKALIQA